MEIMHSTMAAAIRIANKQLSFFSHKTRTKAKLWLKYGNSYEIRTRVALQVSAVPLLSSIQFPDFSRSAPNIIRFWLKQLRHTRTQKVQINPQHIRRNIRKSISHTIIVQKRMPQEISAHNRMPYKKQNSKYATQIMVSGINALKSQTIVHLIQLPSHNTKTGKYRFRYFPTSYKIRITSSIK